MRRAVSIAGLICLFAAPAAFVAASQLSGLGGRYWSRGVSSTSSTACVQDTTDAGSTCALFPAGRAKSQWFNVAVIRGGYGLSASVTGCFTQTATGATVAAGAIATDVARGAGGADCIRIEGAADSHEERPWASDVRSRPGGRSGLCVGSVVSAGDRLYPPCSINPAFVDGVVTASDSRANAAECTDQGLSGANAACVSQDSFTEDQLNYEGVYLLVQSATTQPILVAKKRIQER